MSNTIWNAMPAIVLGAFDPITMVVGVCFALFLIGVISVAVRCLRKVDQGTALVRNGLGGSRVDFSSMFVFPVLHRLELMDISIKRVEIYRHGAEGLVCKDNIRADIKVAFFVRVNKTKEDVIQVASLLGCERASQESALVELFDAKFSEGLKTVGKQFEFVDLYTQREKFKEVLLHVIGRDLNGYILDDAAIDYLEQTPKELLNPNNILDAEGIKKITDLTAREAVLANGIDREKEMTIRKQDVEAREAILELDKQQAEAEQKQFREIATITARETAEAEKVGQEERLKAERARITTEEEVAVAEENKLRQIVVAHMAKERTAKVELERVEKDRELENTERRRVVTLADIEKDKAVEVEKKNIQDVIRERVMVERKVVEEQEKIKDTEQFATADRSKRVQVTKAEEQAQQALIKQVKAAEAEKMAAERHAEQVVIEAEASRSAAEKETHAKKMLAEATSAESAAVGLGEARVTEAKAEAFEKQGFAEASVQKAKAVALEEEGTAEATVSKLKFKSEADGIAEKAKSMKLFHEAGKEHEEFKLKLNKDKDVELAAIHVQQEIAHEQAVVVGQALETAKIDIVGGDAEFFDRIVNSVTGGKVIDRYVGNSQVLTDVKETFFNGDAEYFQEKMQGFVGSFQLDTDDLKNLSIAALIGKMMAKASSDDARSELQLLLEMAQRSGLASKKAAALGLGKK